MDLKIYGEKAKENVKRFLEAKKYIYPGLSEDIIKRVIENATNGKGIRGGSVLANHDIYGGKKEEEAKAASIAVELLHSGALMFDDIIDCDDMRRGLPTMHNQLRDYDPNSSSDSKSGESFAICVAMLTTYLAQEAIADIKDLRAQRVISEVFSITAFAEFKELLNDTDPKISEEDIIKIYKEKTGLYTISGPSMVGAILADAPQEDIEILKEIGSEMGVLFQLKDDLLELEGTSEEIGKSVTSDIFMNNMTFPRLVLYKKADNGEIKKLDSIYGRHPSEEEMELIKDLHKKYSTHEDIELLKQEYKEKCYGLLSKLSRKNSALMFLMEYNDKRKK